MRITGAVLAGGENRRIPVLKGHIEINGKRIIDSNVKLLERFFDRVIISTNAPELYFYCGTQTIGDVIGQRGPLAGIFSVLLDMDADAIFVVACDMPFVKPELIKYIVDKYEMESGRPDAVIPVFEGGPQPLCGIYSKGIINAAEEKLMGESRGLKDILKDLNVLYINENEVRKIDPEGRSFVNINTMEDYEKAISF